MSQSNHETGSTLPHYLTLYWWFTFAQNEIDLWHYQNDVPLAKIDCWKILKNCESYTPICYLLKEISLLSITLPLHKSPIDWSDSYMLSEDLINKKVVEMRTISETKSLNRVACGIRDTVSSKNTNFVMLFTKFVGVLLC